jgi:hypothetical protein
LWEAKTHGRALSGLSNSFVEERSIRDPLNEEEDIRAEMGRLKEPHAVTWDDPTHKAYTGRITNL